MKIEIRALLAAIVISGMGLTACSKPEPGPEPNPEPTPVTSFVSVQLLDYATAGEDHSDGDSPNELHACLFEDGRMTQVYDNPIPGTDGYGFRVDRDAGTLYVLTHATDISDLNDLCNRGVSEQEWLSMTAGTKEGLPIKFYSGKTVLSGTTGNAVQLSRGFARFDLRIRTVGETEIESLSLEGISLHTGLFPDGEIASTDRGNITLFPETPYTKDTPGIAYLYEQKNLESILRVEAIVHGKPYELEAKLPQNIERNHIYIVTIAKEEADQDAQLSVEPWEKEDTDLYPDWDTPIVVDIDKSVLPSGTTIADNGREITLPHTNADFLLALDCNDELEIFPLADDLLTIEPLSSTAAAEELNLFRVQKPLFAPGTPADKIELRFRRKGLSDSYPEDRIVVHLSANPVQIEGLLSFDTKSYVCDFNRYIDNELGRFILPAGTELLVEFAADEDPWIKLMPLDGQNGVVRVVGGWRPNDPTANGRTQSATLVLRQTGDESTREEYRISRRNYGLPVTWFHGVWWCKYNARGNSRSFDDQILSASDPAVAAQKSVLDYLRDCTAEEFYDLWGWAYQGDSGIGMRVVEENGTLVMDGFSTNVSSHINKLPANALAPEGYELPSMEEFNRVFDATDYIWMMWSGSHKLRTPWEDHSMVKREQRRRNDLTVGSVQATDLLYVGMWSPDFPNHEPITWYGPGAQWNADGIKHTGHYNNILFGVHSPEGSGWYIAGNMSALYMQKNGAGNRDTRILRFKKSPVEYIYGEE